MNFQNQYNADGSLERYKVRLVALDTYRKKVYTTLRPLLQLQK